MCGLPIFSFPLFISKQSMILYFFCHGIVILRKIKSCFIANSHRAEIFRILSAMSRTWFWNPSPSNKTKKKTQNKKLLMKESSMKMLSMRPYFLVQISDTICLLSTASEKIFSPRRLIRLPPWFIRAIFLYVTAPPCLEKNHGHIDTTFIEESRKFVFSFKTKKFLNITEKDASLLKSDLQLFFQSKNYLKLLLVVGACRKSERFLNGRWENSWDYNEVFNID